MRSLSLYRNQSLGVRLHTRLRAWSAPLQAVVDAWPRHGFLLDVGCGHGLISNELALRSPDARILGIDLSETKIASAQAIEIVDQQAPAQLRFLHVGIAPRENSASFQRGLHKAGTIQSSRSFTAPTIGHIEKFFRHADKVCFRFVEGPDVFGENMVPV